MRTADEIRAAIRTLERTVVSLPREARRDVMLGEIAALRYVLGEETTEPTLASLLPKLAAVHAEYDAYPVRS